MEDISAKTGKMKKVFVYLRNDQKLDVFSSLTGFMQLDEKTGSQFIVLEDGHRYEVLPEEEGFLLYDYSKSGIRVEQQIERSGKVKIIERTTASLLNDPSSEAQAELQWRVAMPISCILLTIMAVLLSKTNPRQGRFGKLFIALLAYIAYVYVLMLTRSGLKNGDIPLFMGMWWVHGLAVVFILILLGNQFGWRWFLSRIFPLQKPTRETA